VLTQRRDEIKGTHTFELVDLSHEARDVRVVLYPLLVALEMKHVDRVEADERGPETNIGLGEGLASEVARRRQDGLDSIECCDESGVR